MMLSVRVPGGTRSGRCSFAGVFGTALPAPSTTPLRALSLPISAGSATAARTPLPPLRPRSSPFAGAITSGSASAIHVARVAMSSARTPHTSAARASGHSRASAMNSS